MYVCCVVVGIVCRFFSKFSPVNRLSGGLAQSAERVLNIHKIVGYVGILRAELYFATSWIMLSSIASHFM